MTDPTPGIAVATKILTGLDLDHDDTNHALSALIVLVAAARLEGIDQQLLNGIQRLGYANATDTGF